MKEKPYVICHMVISKDGKVTGDFLSDPRSFKGIEAYYQINREIDADAFACGRITMEESFTFNYQPDLKKYKNCKIAREDFVACKSAKRYAIAFDRKGKLGWKNACINDDDPGYGGSHIIQVMCEEVDDSYLVYLQKIGVSYIFAGNKEMNLTLALDKLKKLFGIEKILLEGGSVINTAFEKEKLVDELSLIEVPLYAKENDLPLFSKSVARDYILIEEKKINADGTAFKRYILK